MAKIDGGPRRHSAFFEFRSMCPGFARRTVENIIGHGTLLQNCPRYRIGAPAIFLAMAPSGDTGTAQAPCPHCHRRFASGDDLGRRKGLREDAAVQNSNEHDYEPLDWHRITGPQSERIRGVLKDFSAKAPPILSFRNLTAAHKGP